MTSALPPEQCGQHVASTEDEETADGKTEHRGRDRHAGVEPEVARRAEEAVDWGLVSRVVSHDELLDAATEVLVACCRTAPGARSDIKRELDAYYGLYDRIGMTASLGGEEAMEGWRAFKERRAPSWIHPDLRPEGRI